MAGKMGGDQIEDYIQKIELEGQPGAEKDAVWPATNVIGIPKTRVVW